MVNIIKLCKTVMFCTIVCLAIVFCLAVFVQAATDEQQDVMLSEDISSENTTADDVPISEYNSTVQQEQSWFRTMLDLLLDKLSFMRGDIVTLTAHLVHENNSPVADNVVNFYVNNNQIGADATDNDGVAAVPWDTASYDAGTYLVGASFVGNDTLQPSYDAEIVELEEPVVQPDVLEDAILSEEDTENPVEENGNKTQDGVLQQTNSKINTEEFENIEEHETKNVPGNVDLIEDCTSSEWDESQDVFGTCTGTYETHACSEPVNSTCWNETREYNYTCPVGKKTIHKQKKSCRTDGFIVDDSVKLDTKDYVCSVQKEKQNGKTVLICDSRYDGNGDGACQSGESCMKFEVNGADVKQYEKNSKPDFVEAGTDKSFFLDRPHTEVIA